MITFGKVSSRANTSSLRINPRAIFEEDLFFPFVHIEAEVTEFEKGLRHRLVGGGRSYARVITSMRIR